MFIIHLGEFYRIQIKPPPPPHLHLLLEEVGHLAGQEHQLPGVGGDVGAPEDEVEV